MNKRFRSKAHNLIELKKIIKNADILPLLIVKLSNWKENKEVIKKKINKEIGIGPYIVRSNSDNEDLENQSNAGKFLSELNVQTKNLDEAINAVFKSYGQQDDDDKIFIQSMLHNVKRSGVAFSHDPCTCSPYRVINWEEGNNTAAVTSGIGGRMWQQAAKNKEEIPEKFNKILRLIDELMIIYNETPIDCEFAVTDENNIEKLWLLQVRPLKVNSNENLEDADSQEKRLSLLQKRLEKTMQRHPFLLGRKTVYGVMPDWNPAEIIGVRPKPLALSLYRELITDSIWAYQRNNYGYRNLRSFPLMLNFYGLPYIDVRVSFNSFIPAQLNENTATKLVNYYLERLISEPTLHDKVEFQIVLSSYTLDINQKLENLPEDIFSLNDKNLIAKSLLDLTNNIIHPEKGLINIDAEKLKILNHRREKLFQSDISKLDKIYWLIEDCKRYGTLPFAGLARTGFIAVQMLQSLVNVGIFSQEEYNTFIGGISTISSEISIDRFSMDKENFLKKYEHLRPGTYDINTPRYDEDPQRYFDKWDKKEEKNSVKDEFFLTLKQLKTLKELLKLHKLDIDPVDLLSFIKSAIELREKAKFFFTKNLSECLKLIKEIGLEHNISTEELAYSNISDFKELALSPNLIKKTLEMSIDAGKNKFNDTSRMILPPLIQNPRDIWFFEWPKTEPNFITKKQITSSAIGYFNKGDLKDKIVCIPNADPGFDWLFSYNIAGFITAWGGANSHMAIRAFELQLPAVIGAGEILFKKWSSANKIFIDCFNKKVEIIL